MGSAWPPPSADRATPPLEGSAASWSLAVELAELLRDPISRRALGSAVIVGGGPVARSYVQHVQGMATPSVIAPTDVSFTSLLGGVDAEATLRSGSVQHAEGLLARARDGILTIRTPLNSEASVAEITARIDAGNAPFLLVWHDDDAPVPAQLLDRVGAVIDLRAVAWTAIASTDPFSLEFVSNTPERASDTVPSIDDTLIEALDHGARRMGAASLHTTIALTRTAKVLARRDAASETGLAHALKALRLRFGGVTPGDALADADESTAEPEATASHPPPSEADRIPETTDHGDAPNVASADDALPPLDLILEAIATALPIALDDMEGKMDPSAGAPGKQRSRARAERGRPRGLSTRPLYDGARIDIAATLRAAVPWQRLRPRSTARAIAVRKSDFRYVKRQATAGTTVIFVVDASGSAAVSRLAEAKGAVELLLAQAYSRRDEVALIAFRDGVAQTLLSPTKGLVAAKRSLSVLPGGGATPLAAATRSANELAIRVLAGGRTPLLVFLTDGRGNVALDGRTGRAAAREDEEQTARSLARSGFSTLVIDTSQRPGRHARQFADAVRGRLVPLPRADGASIARTVSEAISA